MGLSQSEINQIPRMKATNQNQDLIHTPSISKTYSKASKNAPDDPKNDINEATTKQAAKDADFEEFLIDLLKTASITHAVNMESDQTANTLPNVEIDEVIENEESIRIIATSPEQNETTSIKNFYRIGSMVIIAVFIFLNVFIGRNALEWYYESQEFTLEVDDNQEVTLSEDDDADDELTSYSYADPSEYGENKAIAMTQDELLSNLIKNCEKNGIARQEVLGFMRRNKVSETKIAEFYAIHDANIYAENEEQNRQINEI